MDISTVVFAIIAIFVVWKLRSVLGTRNGAERPPFDPASGPNPGQSGVNRFQPSGQVVRFPNAGAAAPQPSGFAASDGARWKGFAEPGSNIAAGLDAVARADASFSPENFLSGARAAYEMIVTAFAAGDRATLNNLLARDVFDNFVRAIDERAARGEAMQTTLVSIDAATIEDAHLVGAAAQISVRFATKLISHTKDKSGAEIEGSAEAVTDHLDVWTFSRDTSSRDPNWRLSSTETVH
jgi:predicted lipid-binding transport protein (Tim44 family)